MKKIGALIFVLMVSACQYDNIEPDNTPNLRSLSISETKVAKSTNDFAFKIFNKIGEGEKENSFISPFSISVALAMVLNGAEADTRQSILQTIDFSDLTPDQVNHSYKDLTDLLFSIDKKVELGIANSVWFDQEFKVNPLFASIIQDQYDGRIQALDFNNSSSAKTINNWVESKTNGRIKDLLDKIGPDEIMFLINAIYFKGDWTYQFDKSLTKDASFKTIDGNTTNVKMMKSPGVTLNYFANADLQLVDIPYGNGQFNFTAIIPSTSKDFDSFISTINTTTLQSWIDQSTSVTTVLEMPRFKLTWKKDLKNMLEEMGMKTSGFPDLFEAAPSLQISRVVHQSFLEVNEEGSEAAAATAVGITFTSVGPLHPVTITIDKPFLFIIWEKHSGAILFMGKLVDPSLIPQ